MRKSIFTFETCPEFQQQKKQQQKMACTKEPDNIIR